MNKTHNSLLTAILLVSSFDVSALGINGSQVSNVNGASAANKPIAKDDHASVIIGVKTSAIGNVSSNDLYGNIVTFNGSTVGNYGYLELPGSSGLYTYKLFDTTDTASLPGGTVTDSFTYTYSNDTGQADYARLIVEVNPDPAFAQTDDQPYDNVDVEFNNRSAQATSLNSGRNIKGHLYNSSDKDWYSLTSAGNEIITLEVCPQGTSCFGKKSWVLYVFDPDRLKILNEKDRGENQYYIFKRWLDDTASNKDESDEEIISGYVGISNHMYLAYNLGYYEDALIGIVDPCFGNLNTVDIGVGDGAKDYLIAISSPLLGDKNEGDAVAGEGEESGEDPLNLCGSGSIILEREGRPAAGHEPSTIVTKIEIDAEGNEKEVEIETPGGPKSYSTTEEYISFFPYRDDQYSIKITGTGINPLSTDAAKAKSSSFDLDTETLYIPNIRIDKKIFQTSLVKRTKKARSTDNTLEFIISDFEDLGIDEFVDAYRATYNPENQQVLIPRVTITGSGKAYSVILQYHTATNGGQAWLEVISAMEIL